jgi:ABC-type transport system involved in cytochrome c biogenesis permease subunit
MSEGLLTGLGVALLLAGTGLAVWGLSGRSRLAGAARWCVGSGGYVLLLALVARGLAVRGLPLSSAYEASLLTAALTALAYPLVVPGDLSWQPAQVSGSPRRPAALGTVCSGTITLAILALGALVFPAGARAAQPPPAALAGVWFPLHVSAAAAGYGGLLLAGTAGLLRLLRKHHAEPVLDALISRGLAWGYPLLTLGMTLGAVWGWITWGRYWSWSAKEILTLTTWGLFTLALHTRRLRGWDGWVHAAVLTAGLVVVLVTLFGAEALVRWLGPAVQYVF